MPNDGHDSSLSERVRSLALAPDFKEVLLELTERVEQATAVETVLARASGRPLVPQPRRGRHARPREYPHLRLVPVVVAVVIAVAALRASMLWHARWS